MLKLARPAAGPEPARAPLDAGSLSRLFLGFCQGSRQPRQQ
jgi:hypothetical protein